jgi:hypothetical protein
MNEAGKIIIVRVITKGKHLKLLTISLHNTYEQEKLPPLGNCLKLGFQPVAIARFSSDTSNSFVSN